jgi:integrase
MFNRAKAWGMLKEENPARGIKSFQEEKRERFLTGEEIARLNQALMNEPDWRWRALFPFEPLAGNTSRRTRPLGRYRLRADRVAHSQYQNPFAPPLPLPLAAVQILERLPSRNSSEWLFPGEKANTSITSPSKAWQQNSKAGRGERQWMT